MKLTADNHEHWLLIEFDSEKEIEILRKMFGYNSSIPEFLKEISAFTEEEAKGINSLFSKCYNLMAFFNKVDNDF